MSHPIAHKSIIIILSLSMSENCKFRMYREICDKSILTTHSKPNLVQFNNVVENRTKSDVIDWQNPSTRIMFLTSVTDRTQFGFLIFSSPWHIFSIQYQTSCHWNNKQYVPSSQACFKRNVYTFISAHADLFYQYFWRMLVLVRRYY